MSKQNVQIQFTRDVYEQLELKAAKLGLTVPFCIRRRVLSDIEFLRSYQDLTDRGEKLPSGTKFNIRSLFGVDWTMTKGVKLTLGKAFYKDVEEGTVSDVKSTGKDSSNVMWYEKP
jgi:hypothetical protein